MIRLEPAPVSQNPVIPGDRSEMSAVWKRWFAKAHDFWNGILQLKTFEVSDLPGGITGQVTFATNGRKVGEGPGAGSGVPVYYSNAAWRVYATDEAVQE